MSTGNESSFSTHVVDSLELSAGDEDDDVAGGATARACFRSSLLCPTSCCDSSFCEEKFHLSFTKWSSTIRCCRKPLMMGLVRLESVAVILRQRGPEGPQLKERKLNQWFPLIFLASDSPLKHTRVSWN